MWKLVRLVALAPICWAASVFETAGEPIARNRVDELVFARLQQLNIRAAHPASDAVFLRRVFLSVTGTLPTAREAAAFLADPSPAKRADLIERLLDSDSFVHYQALRWGDLLRIKAEFPINLWPNA